MSGRINLDNMSEDFKSYIQGLDSQLEHIENSNINIKYITAKSLGIYPNMPEKETEFSSMLQDFLLQYANDYIIFFDKGTYYLSGINVNFKKRYYYIATRSFYWDWRTRCKNNNKYTR